MILNKFVPFGTIKLNEDRKNKAVDSKKIKYSVRLNWKMLYSGDENQYVFNVTTLGSNFEIESISW